MYNLYRPHNRLYNSFYSNAAWLNTIPFRERIGQYATRQFAKSIYYPLALSNRLYNLGRSMYNKYSYWTRKEKPYHFEPRVYKKNYLPWGNYISPSKYNGVSKAKKTTRKKTYAKKKPSSYRKKY